MRDVAALPRVELHLHIEGTLEPELIFRRSAARGLRETASTHSGPEIDVSGPESDW